MQGESAQTKLWYVIKPVTWVAHQVLGVLLLY